MKQHMKRVLRTALLGTLAATMLVTSAPTKADEGMWLLPLMQQQNYEKMREMGLRLTPGEIYNPDAPAITDAIVRFGRGCSGSVVSDQGLIFTNHHCGYNEIRQHSTVQHNYLRDGFYATTLQEELPNPGLTVTFTDRVVDVTDFVLSNKLVKKGGTSSKILNKVAEEWYKKNINKKIPFGTQLTLKPFYEGNKYYLFVQTVYFDVRLVAAPPSSVGKFGEDTDNWVWPRHSGDFSVFRVYTDAQGRPAKYSPDNIPMKPKKFLKIAKKRTGEGDFGLMIGFPGTTNHFYTAKEVAERRDIDNDVRIRMRDVRQNEMIDEMRNDEALNIQYASKYAGSTNAYKNAKGSNWAINKMNLEKVKGDQVERLLQYARENGKQEYIDAVKTLDEIVERRAPIRKRIWMIDEALMRAIEAVKAPVLSKNAIKDLQAGGEKQQTAIQSALKAYDGYFNKDYSRALDKKVSKAMLKAYTAETAYEDLPEALKDIQTVFNGDVDQYVENLWDKTVLQTRESYEAFLKNFNPETYKQDPLVRLVTSVRDMARELSTLSSVDNQAFKNARQTYIKGFLEMDGELNLWPDANSTIRYTFGKVKGYSPRDNVYYGHQTTAEGVLEKYDPNNPEYALLPSVKELIEQGDNRKRPVNFCLTTHTTGGNSGSPVVDGYGRLIGLNFDRNWEGVGGDIQYLPDYQRSIICDVHYVVFILQDYLKADRLIDELVLE